MPMHLKDADKMANGVDSDQTAPEGAVWSGSAQICLSQNIFQGKQKWYTEANGTQLYKALSSS